MTIYLQHEDPEILIPQHISRKAFYSATGFLINAIISFIFDYKISAPLLFTLFVTTLLHWNKVKHKGIIKTIDIFFAVITSIYLLLVDSYRFCPEYQVYWFYGHYITVSAFVINECIFYLRTTPITIYIPFILRTSVFVPCSNVLTFYTKPNTYERELVYYINAYTHMFFCHIQPTVLFTIFSILSHYKCNKVCE